MYNEFDEQIKNSSKNIIYNIKKNYKRIYIIFKLKYLSGQFYC